jgi:hypothetical protein
MSLHLLPADLTDLSALPRTEAMTDFFFAATAEL